MQKSALTVLSFYGEMYISIHVFIYIYIYVATIVSLPERSSYLEKQTKQGNSGQHFLQLIKAVCM